jgi:hypothetical protein
MLTIKSKKILSLTLCTLLATSIFGGVAAEAHPFDYPPPHPHHREYKSDSHSEGEVITAGIVGAVLGAVIAKNT